MMQTMLTICLVAGALPGGDTFVVPTEFPTIQSAIDAARDGDEVLVLPGLYQELINLDGKMITLRSQDGPEVTTIAGTDLDGTVVTCDSNEDPATIIRGFTITDGFGTIKKAEPVGAGFLLDGASPTIEQCVITGMTAYNGAGAHIVNGSPSFVACEFSFNTAENAGSALYAEASDVSMQSCTIEHNAVQIKTFEQDGNVTVKNGSLTMTGCEVRGNDEFGAVSVDGSIALLEDCLFEENDSGFNDTGTGAIISISSATMVRNCVFDHNPGTGGGAIGSVGAGAVLAVERSVFIGNSAEVGGAIRVTSGEATIADCGFHDNFTDHFVGGAIAIEPGVAATITHCTFTGNHSASQGGAIAEMPLKTFAVPATTSSAINADARFAVVCDIATPILHVIDLTTDELASFSDASEHIRRAFSVAIHPHGTKVVQGALHNRVVTWRFPECTLEAVHELPGLPRNQPISSLAFSPDGRWLAAASYGHIAVIQFDPWSVVEVLAHPGELATVQFSPDMSRLFAGCREGAVRLWDLPDLRPVGTLHIGGYPLWDLEVTPDGTALVVGGQPVHILRTRNAANGRQSNDGG